MKRKYLALILLPLLVTSFLSVGLLTAQVNTNVLSMSGKDWSIKVDSNLQTSIDSKAIPTVEVSKAGAEKELFLTLNSLKDCVAGQIQFKIETQGLTVYKQLPLDKELSTISSSEKFTFVNATHAMVDEEVRVYRPENVVNSFACFDDSGKKVLHIYASKLIDAKGAEVWVDSDLKDGLLTVYLNQKWLEAAVFPVVVDPTFGYTSVGGTSGDASNTYIWFSKVTTPNYAGTLMNYTLYTGVDGVTFTCALYSIDGNKLDVSEEGTAVNGGWVTVDSSTQTYEVSANTDYYLGFYVSASASGFTRHDGTSGNIFYESGQTYPTFPSTVTPTDYSARSISVYASYDVEPEVTPSPSPSPSPSPTPVLEGDLSDTQWFAGALIFILVIFNIVLFMLPFALMRFVFAVVSLALCALAFAYAVPFSPYLQLLGCLVSVLSMYFASRARE